jgi:glycosyltransferase involved in cell wall biosynthesis
VLEALRGGTSRHLVDLVRHTDGTVHHVAVPPPPPAGRDWAGGAPYDAASLERLAQAGAVLHSLAMDRRPAAPVNAAAVARLVRLVRHVRPDVVHGHSSVGGALARLAGAVVDVEVAYTPNGVASGAAYLRLERLLGMLTWRWVAVSPSEAAQARDLGLVEPGRIVTIPNGVDPDPPPASSDLRARLGLPPATPLVGTVARLVAQKAPVDFVRMAATAGRRRPDAHFLLIGAGPLTSQVEEEARRSGLGPRWHRLDHVEHAESLLGQLDVFVLVSRFEGAPYTPLEAMRAGVPVVLTDVVGSRDCVEAGHSGLVCQMGDVAGLAEAVSGLLADPRRRRELGQAGRQRVRERFDVADMGRRLEAMYRQAPKLRARTGAGSTG